MNLEKKFNFPKFEDIPVSTNTFIIMSNLVIDIKKIFEFLPITEYVIIPKRRGRKKKIQVADPNKHIKEGSIITLKLGPLSRGIILKKKKKLNKASDYDYFRNSMTTVMIIEDKKINFKISQNGKFQMTGCKSISQAEKCIQYIWNYIKNEKEIHSFSSEEKDFKALFIPAMRNIDFSLGFTLNREKLDAYINNNTDYYSLLETSIGYTGVNIKIPITKSILELKIKQIVNKDGEWEEPTFVPYENYLDRLKVKEKQKKLIQERYNTFLVFHSGKVIMSSMCELFAKDVYYEFLKIISENMDKFVEVLQ